MGYLPDATGEKLLNVLLVKLELNGGQNRETLLQQQDLHSSLRT